MDELGELGALLVGQCGVERCLQLVGELLGALPSRHQGSGNRMWLLTVGRRRIGRGTRGSGARFSAAWKAAANTPAATRNAQQRGLVQEPSPA